MSVLVREFLGLTCVLLLASCGGDDAPVDDGGSTRLDGGPRPRRDSGPTMPVDCDAMPERAGEATYYDATGAGACGFAGVTSGPLLVAALNFPDWSGSEYCGACAHIVGPSGEVTVRIVDQCPECASGDLDLSPEAFDLIAERALGRVPITWREVPCDVGDRPVIWHVKDGSNQWWSAFQLRDHRHRVVSLEIERSDGSYVSLPREDYNYFVDADGPGTTVTLRATDVHGATLTSPPIPVEPADADHPGDEQFPPCAP